MREWVFGAGVGEEVKCVWRGLRNRGLCGQCESLQNHSTIMISLHNTVMPLCGSNVVFSFRGGGSLIPRRRIIQWVWETKTLFGEVLITYQKP